MQIKHPSGIDQRIVDKVVARRGRLHAFEDLVPAKTALVVVDMDSATVRRMSDTEIMDIIKSINDLAAALRDAGGVVAWITTPIRKASDNFRAIFGEKTADMYEDEGKEGGEGRTLWHELKARPSDLHVTKSASSALFPGKSDLDELLRQKGVDTLLIVGVVTNVCCYATAIDGAALGYKVTMVSDAMQGQSYGLGEAHMATFFRVYGDVRPSHEVLGLIG
jgi:nicotinamidase-related amidase